MTKTNIIKLLFLFTLFGLLCFPAVLPAAMAMLQADSLQTANERLPETRRISAESLQELQNDAAMDYYLGNPDDNLWLMFRNWLYVQFLRLFGSAEALSVLELIVYTTCLIALVYLVLRLLNVDLSGLLMNSKRKAVIREEGMETEEDIHGIDFQTALAEALQNREYHKAIRLLYLSALKELSEEEHIYWQAGKTNYQYQQELRQEELLAPFRQLGHLFEWAWYGNFPVGETQFRRAEQFYRSLEQQMKQRT